MSSHLRTLIWLRWAITRRTLSRLGWAMRLFSLSLTAVLAFVIFRTCHALLRDTADPVLALRVLLAIVTAMGVVLPLLSFHRGAATDPSALFRFPIRAGSVFVGGVLSRMFSLAAIYPLAVALAAALALSPDRSLVTIARVLLVYFVFHSWLLITTQVGLLTFHTLLARRRVRDALNIVSALIGVGVYLAMTAFRRDAMGSDLAAHAASVPDALWWLLPSTWAADLMTLADGRGWWCFAEAALLAVAVVAGLVLGARASVRAFFAEVQSAATKTVARRSDREPFSGLGWLPVPARVRAIVARELRHVWRDPLMKSMFIRQLGFVLLPVLLPMIARESLPPGSTLIHLVGVLLMVGEAELLLNLFAVEGKGLRQTLSHPVSGADLLFGKNVAYGLCLLPFNTAAMLVMDAVAGWPVSPVVVLVEAVAILLVATGVGNVASLYFPLPMPQLTQRAIQTQAHDGKGGRILGRLAFILVLGVVTLPVVIAAVFIDRFPIGVQFAFLIGMMIYAGVCYLLTVMLVDRQLQHRLERLLKALE